MKKYRRESELSRDVVTFLRSHGFFVQRIESPKTGVGIPDLYCSKGGEGCWIELKLVKRDMTEHETGLEVTWRPGQRSWLYRCWRSGVRSYTLIAYRNGYKLLCMDHMIEDQELIDKTWYPSLTSCLL